jgi:hypothetical protein
LTPYFQSLSATVLRLVLQPKTERRKHVARTLQKHVARRQDQTFADWFAELRDLAGERWPDLGSGAGRLRNLDRRRNSAAGFVHDQRDTAGEGVN